MVDQEQGLSGPVDLEAEVTFKVPWRTPSLPHQLMMWEPRATQVNWCCLVHEASVGGKEFRNVVTNRKY